MRKLYLVISGAIIIFILAVAINQWVTLRKAHRTFENYYAFRGCAQLVEKTDNYGLCKLTSGETIKIVKFHNKWYLNNDLPICLLGYCF